MLGKLRKLLVLVGLVEGARRFAKANPEAAAQIAAQVAGLVDNLTKGKFHNQIDGLVRKLQGGED
ncbi:MAG: antitoxin [Pseudonocardiaceae bacterium]